MIMKKIIILMAVAFALAAGDRACGGQRGAPGLCIIGGGGQACG